MKERRVLVINLGWEQEPLLDELIQRGYKLFGVHYDENYYKKPTYENVLITEVRNLEQISEFASASDIDAVISDQCDYSYFAQAVIASRLKLPGPSILEAQTATNKYFQRVLAKEKDLLIPDFQLCKSPEEARLFAEKNGYPVILKPVDNRGSFGVNKAETANELEWAYYEALLNSHSRCVLVEDFIHGTHITVDGYSLGKNNSRSLALATKTLLGGKHQVAMDIRYPGELSSEFYDRAFENNEKVNNALGFSFGMLHSEYMVTTAGEPYLIETANRGGGVFTSEIIVPAVSGLPVLERYVDDCLGIKSSYDLSRKLQQNGIILKFFQLKPGRVKNITGLDEIGNDKSVLKIRVAVKPGDTIPEIRSDAHRHGFMILRNNGDTEALMAGLLGKLKVEYEG